MTEAGIADVGCAFCGEDIAYSDVDRATAPPDMRTTSRWRCRAEPGFSLS